MKVLLKLGTPRLYINGLLMAVDMLLETDLDSVLDVLRVFWEMCADLAVCEEVAAA